MRSAPAPAPAKLPFYASTALASGAKGWGTPRPLFDALCRRWCGVRQGVEGEVILRPWVDPCALSSNALLPRFFSPEENGLAQSWCPPPDAPQVVIYNPPYGDPEEACHPTKCRKKGCQERGFHLNERVPGIIDWVGKGMAEALAWRMVNVGIFPSRQGTEWWASMLKPKPELAGRWMGGLCLPGFMSPMAPFWPVVEWRAYRWERYELEVCTVAGRLTYQPEPGSRGSTGKERRGKECAPFDTALVAFRGV